MNILIPMAGRGSRFNQFDLPKPLIKIGSKPMIWHAVKSLELEGHYIYITRQYDDYILNLDLNCILQEITPNCDIIQINHITEGPACSALLAKEIINNDESLIITNCDRISNWNSQDFLNAANQVDVDGLVVTWNKIATTESFIEIDENGYGKRLAEKQIISDQPLNGIHYWNMGKYFVDSAEKTIKKNIRVNNEFYVSTTFNQMIEDGYKIKTYKLKPNQHFSVGDPEDLKRYKRWINLT